jgi:hypothetical protein
LLGSRIIEGKIAVQWNEGILQATANPARGILTRTTPEFMIQAPAPKSVY